MTRPVSYRDLIVWQKAMDLAVECYREARLFPAAESYGMAAQIRRASVSVPANIAEGNGRESSGSYIQALRIAHGSLKELETHVLLAQRVELMSSAASERLLALCAEVGKLLRALIRAIQDKARSP